MRFLYGIHRFRTIRNWRHLFQLERRIEESSLKTRMKEKTCQLDEFCWLVLRSLVSQRLVLLTRRKKERKNAACVLVICCLTSNAYHAGYALLTTRLLRAKRSIILSDFRFEEFFLLVIDIIKPPGTYFNNNVDCRISLIVDLWSSALLSLLPAFFCMLRWIQFESQSGCNLNYNHFVCRKN